MVVRGAESPSVNRTQTQGASRLESKENKGVFYFDVSLFLSVLIHFFKSLLNRDETGFSVFGYAGSGTKGR